ncbi:hypothetical protein scyTo_0016705 [Scyliorhinus torazame]|uniref:Uncharacterized protein n=1 Tax=Scyliorhinus torazame TaxID=75743 RepID=A0A401PWL0_SCYTO|nr:hypothetical protein [Scyliorhinus torazame]
MKHSYCLSRAVVPISRDINHVVHLPQFLVASQHRPVKLELDGIYDVVTIGAPAAHIRGFRNGGLRRQLYRFEGEKRNSAYQYIYYSPEDTTKAKEVITNIYKLQPLMLTNTDLLLTAARQHSSDNLKDSLKTLSEITEQFVHAFEDQLLRSALLALHKARPSYINKRHSNLIHNPDDTEKQCENSERRSSKDSIPHHAEYDEEDWDRVWVNVGKSLNCIIAMVDRLLEQSDTGQKCEIEPSPVDQIAASTSGRFQIKQTTGRHSSIYFKVDI